MSGSIHELIEKAEKEGLSSLASYVKENYVEEEVATILAAVRGALEKSANFLKIEINEDHGDMRVHCPMFDKNVEIEDTCYGCRYNPGTGRWEGRDGEYFQCNYNPAVDVQVWPATRSIQRPTKSSFHGIVKKAEVNVSSDFGKKVVDVVKGYMNDFDAKTKAEFEAADIEPESWDFDKYYVLEEKQYEDDGSPYVEFRYDGILYEIIEEYFSDGAFPSFWEGMEQVLENNNIEMERESNGVVWFFPPERWGNEESDILESSSKKIEKEAQNPVAYLSEDEEVTYCPDCRKGEKGKWHPLYGDPEGEGLLACDGCADIYDPKSGGWIDKQSTKKQAQADVIEEVEQSQQDVIEKQVSLPDQEDLSRFNNLSKEELENQLRMYTDLNKVLADAPPGENIKLQDTLAIIEHITELLGKTPEVLENNDTVIEEVKEEDLDALREKMHTDYDESEINEVAASLSKKKIPLTVVSKEEAEEEASRLGFIKLESLTKEAPAILDRCVKKVMAEHKGDKNFTKSNAYAICISSLQDKHPSVKNWVHRKKTEVNKMKKIEDAKMSELTVPDLKARLQALNDAEFVVRSSMNIRDEASLVEGNSLIKKISSERDRINALLSFQIDTSVFEKTTPKEKFAYDSKSIENIPHSLAGEFKKTASKQAEYDWETYLDVVPKLLVEQNQILQSWPALMAEAARQEIFPKIASLPANKQEELFLKFMERVEQERKAIAKGEGIEIEASVKETDVPDDPRNLFI